MVTKIMKEAAELWLRGVTPDEVFRFHDGRMVKNLDKIPTTLRGMTGEA